MYGLTLIRTGKGRFSVRIGKNLDLVRKIAGFPYGLVKFSIWNIEKGVLARDLH